MVLRMCATVVTMQTEQRAPPHSDTIRVVRGFQWTYVSTALQGAVKLIVLLILARVLSPRDFGLLGFALMCTNFVERMGQFGVGPALVQASRISCDTIYTARLLSVALGVISASLVWWSGAMMARFFSQPELEGILIVLSMGCVLEALTVVPDALLQRSLRFKEIMIAENLAYAVAMGGIAIVLALLGWGVWSLVVATLVLKLVRLMIVRRFVDTRQSGHCCISDARRLLWVGTGFSLGRLLNFFSLQGDNFVVGRLLGVEALGMYNRAYQLMTLPAMYIGQVFEKVMFPSMAQKQDSPDRIAREFLLTLEAIGIVALPAGVFLYALAKEIIEVGFGHRWHDVIPVVSILSCGVFFRTAYKCSDIVVRSVGAVYHYAARQALYSVMVVVGAAAGALVDRLVGVAVGVVIAVALNYLSMTRLCSTLIDLSARRILKAHISGVFVSVWVMVILACTVPMWRAASMSSVLVLLYGTAVASIGWLVGVIVAYVVLPQGVLHKACSLAPFLIVLQNPKERPR